jgi:tetratricopeptide repeat protein
VVLLYAGRRAQSLPTGSETLVSQRARRLLAGLGPSAVVGSAADGADLLILEAALEGARARPHVVLPSTPVEFERASVQEAWRRRHRQALDRVAEVASVISLGLPDGADAYEAANTRMLQLAAELAGDGERVACLVVAAPGEGTMVEHLSDAARLHGMPVLRIDPTVDPATRPSCFVAMPFGRRLDPQRRIELDCDLYYRRVLVPALEHAQLRYRRADEQIDSGLVLQPLLHELAEADLVIADLATGSFNVGWELGLRHLLRERQTVLTLPAGTIAPFDVSAVRHVAYEHGEHGISDDAAIAAWDALAPLLAATSSGQDSDNPLEAVTTVHYASLQRRTAVDARWDRIRSQLALARDLGDATLMLDLMREARDLPEEQGTLLRAEAGAGLVRLGNYSEARELLKALVVSDPGVTRPDAHVFYAQALYRPADAPVDDLDDAERILNRLLVARPGHPEVHAAIGAVGKRRAGRRTDASGQARDLRLAFRAYAHDYERNLSAYYEGVNLVAVGSVLARVHHDRDAAARARGALPAVRLAADLAVRHHPADYWAAVTFAEAELHTLLLGGDGADLERVAARYREAGALRPPRGDVDSSLAQLAWLARMGIEDESLTIAAEALRDGAE